MHVAYIGNFDPPYSTENDILSELEAMGHRVTTIQEGVKEQLHKLTEMWVLPLDSPERHDLLLWTSTRGLADRLPDSDWLGMLYLHRLAGIPTAAIHLDRWWGLDRQADVLACPWFDCDVVATADGGHDPYFAAAGVNHMWSLPAIAAKNAHISYPSREFTSDIAFVGNHFPGNYHDEWTHRPELVKWLNRQYRGRVVFYPRRTRNGGIEPAIRGERLNELYASAKVVVGDSCLVPKVDGTPMTHYCSDRVFETIGRGGYLLHPNVAGVTDGPLVAGEHLDCWELGDWGELKRLIDRALGDDDYRRQISQTGFQHVRANHTYQNRLTALFARLGLS